MNTLNLHLMDSVVLQFYICWQDADEGRGGGVAKWAQTGDEDSEKAD